MIIMIEYNNMIIIDTREDMQTSHSIFDMMMIVADEMSIGL